MAVKVESGAATFVKDGYEVIYFNKSEITGRYCISNSEDLYAGVDIDIELLQAMIDHIKKQQ